MAKSTKVWLTWVAAILCLIVGAAYWNSSYKIGFILFWSFVNGEQAIGMWLGIGVSFKEALLLVVVPSVIDIYGWFYAADNFVEPALNKYWGLIPKKPQIDKNSRLYGWIKKAPYLSMPLLGLIPTGIWFGVGVTRWLNLNKKATFVLLALGNSLKMILAGLGFASLGTVFGMMMVSGLTLGIGYVSKKLLLNNKAPSS